MGFMSISDMKRVFGILVDWFRSVEPDGKTYRSHLRRIEWCLLSDHVIHRWLFNIHGRVKRYRKQHNFSESELTTDANGKCIANGPYDSLLNEVYSVSMEFMTSYQQFPWKLK